MKSIIGMTPAQLREAAHEAIIRELGVAGLARYLSDTSLGSGDYTQDRHAILPEYQSAREMLDDLRREIAKHPPIRGAEPGPPQGRGA